MAVSGHLQLILLIPVFSFCGATEYYVKPTEPTNTSCPAQPCLTLNQYVNNSDRYFQSNTVFKFLPGTHRIDRPVTIGNVHNMSLESFSSELPHLVAQFSCNTEANDCIPVSAWYYHFNVCCAAFWLHDVHNVTFNGLTVEIRESNVSGIILRKVKNVYVQLTTTYACSLQYCYGIALLEADSVEVQSSSVYNCTLGLLIDNGINIHSSNIAASQNRWGVVLSNTHNVSIANTKAVGNEWEGMELSDVSNVHITYVTAMRNGGLGMYLWNMNNSHIIYTNTSHNGGYGVALYNISNTDIINATTTHNSLGGMFSNKMNNTNITNVIATLNGGNYSGVHGGLLYSGQLIFLYSTHTQIYNSSFTDVKTPNTVVTEDPGSLPAVIAFYHSSVRISGCNFIRNCISAIRGHASNITVSGKLNFSYNTAFAGTAFILVQDSVLSLKEMSCILFLHNQAMNNGGVFYITTSIHVQGDIWAKSTICFLHVEGRRFQSKLTFMNNSAGMGGDILYGGQVALGLDGDWNCLDSFKNISNIIQKGLSSLISSDPSRVCLCNENGQPNCTNLNDLCSIYPGQSINISVVVVGQDFGTVAGSVYAQFLRISSQDKLPHLVPLQKVQAVKQKQCSNLQYTIHKQSEVNETVLILTAHDSNVSEYVTEADPKYVRSVKDHYRTDSTEPLIYSDTLFYLNISFLSCPRGFMLTNDPPFRCHCNLLLQRMHGVQCHIQDQTIGRSGQLWVGMMQDDNGTNGTVAASEYCSLNYCKKEVSNVTLSEPDSQCNFNHSGTLCGGCQPGLSLALGSIQCLPCSNKYLALLIPFTLAGPVLVAVIKLLDLTISRGTLNGLIFYANIIEFNDYIFLPQRQTNPLTIFIAWFNLDLGVETCFFHGLSAYSKTWLQFVFPLYIWSIAGLIIILAKYSDRVAKVMGNNSVPVLATLFILSYAKIFHTIITALSNTIVYTSHGHKAVWTADGNVDYLGPKHAPLFAVAVGTLLFLWLPYTLLLFLGQWLHMCNCRLISHILIKIKPFLDAHYGPLKGKHRYWFGALLLVRAAIDLIQALTPADGANAVVLCILVFAIVLTHYGQLVYRNLAVSAFDTSFYMNLVLLTATNLFSSAVGKDPTVAAYILIGIAFLQFVALVFFKTIFILKQNERVITCLQEVMAYLEKNEKVMICLEKLMACLHKEQPVEDDWEAYEEAAILREREVPKQQDREGREGYESTVSVPTY